MHKLKSHKDGLLQLMKALKEHNSSATFFLTGKYYEKYPEMVNKMLGHGFEVGYHSHTHKKILTEEDLVSELTQSKKFIDAVKPKGFRAPWIYLPSELLPVLRKWGFEYDSSTFSSPGNHFIESGLHIFPITSIQYSGLEKNAYYPKTANLKMLRNEFPIGSGIFVSLLRKFYKLIFNKFEKSNRPIIFYIHDWQLGESPANSYRLLRDRLRYTHRYPLLNTILNWIDQFKFRSLDSLLHEKNGGPQLPFAHYLTIDVEHIDN